MSKQAVLSKYFVPRPIAKINNITKDTHNINNVNEIKKNNNDNNNCNDNDNSCNNTSPSPTKKLKLCKENKLIDEPKNLVIEPGIVILKKFLTMEEQQSIVEECFEKGSDTTSGFYKPKVLVWNKLCQMKINQMCMGYHWNARLHKYETTRSDHDNSPVHEIPELFKTICKKVVQESKRIDTKNLPETNPNSCIVNFYEEGHTLGFHRDASESKKSILDGKPVISLSIGSSADFQYYYGKDERASKKTILLESGDVLVFGGPARSIYHGVPKVYINDFPKQLKMPKKGRINVTFREL